MQDLNMSTLCVKFLFSFSCSIIKLLQTYAPTGPTRDNDDDNDDEEEEEEQDDGDDGGGDDDSPANLQEVKVYVL